MMEAIIWLTVITVSIDIHNPEFKGLVRCRVLYPLVSVCRPEDLDLLEEMAAGISCE